MPFECGIVNDNIRRTADRKTGGPRYPLKDLRARANEGDTVAKQGVEAIEEEFIRAAGITADPGLTKGRRKEALRAGVRRLASEKIKLDKGI